MITKDNSFAQWRCYARGTMWRKSKGYIVHTLKGDGHGSVEHTHRTPGKPATVRRIYESYGMIVKFIMPLIRAKFPSLPVSDKEFMRLVIMTIATETRGKGGKESVRHEPGYISDNETPHRVSAGLMQTLLSNAREDLQNDQLTVDHLLNPLVSIMAGMMYIANREALHIYDPVLLLATYNAGRPKYTLKNHWHMVCYWHEGSTKCHIDWGISRYNDFVFYEQYVMKEGE